MEHLECDRCGRWYSDQENVDWAKQQTDTWKELCRRDGVEPRGLVACPVIPCEGEMILISGRRRRPNTPKEALERYPRLVGHLICASLGYFTPETAANAVLNYIRGEPNWCEWYTHMARGWDTDKLLQVGRHALEDAVRGRHHHQGYMAHYPQAQALVEHVLKGGAGPAFASWF